MKLLTWKSTLFGLLVLAGSCPSVHAQQQSQTALEILGNSAPRDGLDGPIHRDSRLDQTSFVSNANAESEAISTPVPNILAGGTMPETTPKPKSNPVPLKPLATAKSQSEFEKNFGVNNLLVEDSGPAIPSVLTGLSTPGSYSGPPLTQMPELTVDVAPPISLAESNVSMLNPLNPAAAPKQITLMPLTPVERGGHSGSMSLSDSGIVATFGESLELQPISTGKKMGNDLREPIELFEIEPTAKRSLYDDTDSDFSVAQMTGPMSDAVAMINSRDTSLSAQPYPTQPLPQVRRTNSNEGYSSLWTPTSYTWITPSFEHKPLYFEQPNLERYGIRPRPALEPAISASIFFGSVAVLPLRMICTHPCTEVSTLGQQRPGVCADYLRTPIIRR